jgi:beta-glucosidase-like glycosyl hydrolase
MVGIPGDFKNFQDNPYINRVINLMGIGNLFLNKYNLYTSDKDRNLKSYSISIRKFIEYLHEMALSQDALHKLPLFIACDFESPTFTSVPHIVTQPPAALTLACTQDATLIQETGNYMGYQLKSLGIDGILGPVLDSSKPFQDKSLRSSNTSLRNRTFGDSQTTVYNIATHYVTGLREAGIQVIGKHFPSHGAVSHNPHSWHIPEYNGSVKSLKNEWAPFPGFRNYLDGVMTSHIRIASLRPKHNRLVTLSHLFVSRILRQKGEIQIGENQTVNGLDYKDQVIISDDLSDMGSIRKYMYENQLDFSEMALQAYKAGHDILLYSHIELENTPRRGKIKYRAPVNIKDQIDGFTMDDIQAVIQKLTVYIKATRQNELEFRDKLYRILLLKAKAVKSRNGTISDNRFHFAGIDWTDRNFDSKNLPPNIEGKYKNAPALIKKIFQKATLKINEEASYIINELPHDQKMLFCIYGKYLKLFKSSFQNSFKDPNFIKIPKTKSKSVKSNIKKFLFDHLKQSDKIIYTVLDKTDADLIEETINYFGVSNIDQKFILLLHTEPNVLSSQTLHHTTVIGNFTIHESAFKADLDILSGRSKPEPIDKLTVSIGVGSDSVYESAGTAITPANNYDPIPPKTTVEAEKSNQKYRELNQRFEKKSKCLNCIVVLIILASSFSAAFISRELILILRDSKYNFKFISALLLKLRAVSLVVFGIGFVLVMKFFYDILFETNTQNRLLNTWAKAVYQFIEKLLLS